LLRWLLAAFARTAVME